MAPTSTRLAALSTSILWLACASSPVPEAGTGDVSFRVVWEGISDLDLHVTDPDGEHLSHLRRGSGSGGMLDVDCNGDRICDAPIENIFWPLGAAPPGRYRFWVRVHRVQEGEPAIPARLLVLRGDEIAWEERATLTRQAEILGPFLYTYDGGPHAPPELEPAGRAGVLGRWACTTERPFPVHGVEHGLELDPTQFGMLFQTQPERANYPVANVRVDAASLSFDVVVEEEVAAQFRGAVEGDLVTGEYVPREGPAVPTTCVRR
jgi:hypothetical protein